MPALTFVNLPGSGLLGQFDVQSLYNLQQALPVQIIVPQALALIFISLLGTSLLALIAMARVVYRVAVSQALHLNED